MNAGYFDQTDSKYLFLSLPSSYFRLRQILIRSILVKLTPSTYCLHQSIKCSLVVERSTLRLQKLVLDKSKIGEVKSARGHNRFSRYKGSHESSSLADSLKFLHSRSKLRKSWPLIVSNSLEPSTSASIAIIAIFPRPTQHTAIPGTTGLVCGSPIAPYSYNM